MTIGSPAWSRTCRRPSIEVLHIDARPAGVAGVLGVIAVGTAEERRGVRIGGERLEPLGPHPSQALARECVAADVGDARRFGPHGVQAAPRDVEVGALGQKSGIVAHGLTTLPLRPTGLGQY